MRAPGLLLLCLLAGSVVSAAPVRNPAASGRARAASRASKNKKKPPRKQVRPVVTPVRAQPADVEAASAAVTEQPSPRARASRDAAPTWGSVTYVSSERVYLDRGRDEGLEKDAELVLSRRGRPAGKCRIEWVADHHAACQGKGLREGDRFDLPKREASATVAARPLPASTTELTRRRALLESSTQPLVEYASGRTGSSRRPAVQVALDHTSWASNTGGDFHQERLDVALRGFPLGAGFRVWLDASARAWASRPEDFRSPSRTVARLYVREGEVTRREAGEHLALAVGRVWPWYVPGVAMFDGAQLGWRSTDGDFEVGAFGGGVPDAATLTPSFRRMTAGAYVAGQHVAAEGSALRMLHHEARVSFMSAPEYGERFEAEGRVRAWLGRSADVGAWVRLGLGDAMAPGGVDAARLDVEVRPSQAWRLSGGARYTGTMALDVPPPLGELTLSSRTVHGDATALWQPAPWLSAGLTGLLVRDIETALSRQLVGPEVGLPRLFGDAGGVSLGYQEELGWMRGRSAHVQALVRPVAALRLLGRVSWFEEEPVSGATGMAPTRDLGMYVSTDYAPVRSLSLRLSVLARVDANNPDEGLTRPGGLVGQASLAGSF
ncbi:hypothetical protein [Myxococcus sp. RHSTA-1-4]|uniref:hypothetical protein n=1 Tax=Myxococcus sp. RHSTA-1-4 TaxID=2874601 RepID=UPI001CBD16E2|nr:hypothetical protein [Myxococcus sp. RHSTA-1-4]MBZ4418599.1 hypothetical protein [Myxococcus sp. RHSTA-1-4]